MLLSNIRLLLLCCVVASSVAFVPMGGCQHYVYDVRGLSSQQRQQCILRLTVADTNEEQYDQRDGEELSTGTPQLDDTSVVPTVAPIYITIGPPCSGKTEALRSCLLSDGYDPDDVFTKDVSLDDQDRVYHRIPLAAYLFPSTQLKPDIAQQTLASGATVQERLLDTSFDQTDQEIRNVILRIAGRSTPEQFQEGVRKLALQAGDSVKFFKDRRIAVGEDLIKATEEVAVQAVSEVICQIHFKVPKDDNKIVDELPYCDIDDDNDDDIECQERITITQEHQHLADASPVEVVYATQEPQLLSARDLIKTPYLELFVPEGIFRGGIDSANKLLSQLANTAHPEQPVSWGNTNTRPAEYAKTLAAAEEAGRPVKFVAWGTGRLPRVSRQELLRRNVARFRNSGRYIPAGAVGAALGRVDKLLNEAQVEAKILAKDDAYINEPEILPGDRENQIMDAAFASLAGFRRIEGGFVVKVGEPKDSRSKKMNQRSETPKL